MDVIHIQHEHLAEDSLRGYSLMLQSYKNHLLADQIRGIPGHRPFEGQQLAPWNSRPRKFLEGLHIVEGIMHYLP